MRRNLCVVLPRSLGHADVWPQARPRSALRCNDHSAAGAAHPRSSGARAHRQRPRWRCLSHPRLVLSQLRQSANLAPAFFSATTRKYLGTRLGSQETSGEETDETGIVVAGRDGRNPDTADCSGRMAPPDWAKTAIAPYRAHKADRIAPARKVRMMPIEWPAGPATRLRFYSRRRQPLPTPRHPNPQRSGAPTNDAALGKSELNKARRGLKLNLNISPTRSSLYWGLC